MAGAALGVALTALVATAGRAIGVNWSLGLFDLVLAALPIAVVVGYTRADAAVATAQPIRVAAGAAARASLLGVLVVWLVAAVASGSGGSSTSDAGGGGVLMLGALMLVFGLVFSLLITLPIAVAAVATLRLSRRRPLATPLVVVGAAALSAMFVAVGPGGIAIPLGPRGPWESSVELSWTVNNRSPERLVLSVNDSDPASRSIGGSLVDIEGCFITTETSREAADWSLALNPGWVADPDPFASPLVSAADVPGDHPRVWIDVAPDGAVTVTHDRSIVDERELLANLCGGPHAGRSAP